MMSKIKEFHYLVYMQKNVLINSIKIGVFPRKIILGYATGNE